MVDESSPSCVVIPAKVGIHQLRDKPLDSRFRGSDGVIPANAGIHHWARIRPKTCRPFLHLLFLKSFPIEQRRENSFIFKMNDGMVQILLTARLYMSFALTNQGQGKEERMKKLLTAACMTTALAVAAPVSAGWIPVTDSLAGNLSISGLGGESGFSIELTSLEGDVNFVALPKTQLKGVYVRGQLDLYAPPRLTLPGLTPPIFSVISAGFMNIFKGMLGIPDPELSGMEIIPLSFGSLSTQTGSGSFDIVYDGFTSNAFIAAINSTIGTELANTQGSGGVTVEYTYEGDSVIMGISETFADWMGFERLLDLAGAYLRESIVDALSPPFDAFVPAYNGTIAGRFELTNAEIKFVPEPGSLALFGLGMAGLAAAGMRRRRV
ncbi:PEP-CTERM sorting domain-containing protein [Ectothiorhodospira lacustris]|uniref:PEP-CTERM sorting domain-containing protein n=1 Tax=Ectothiorhodospira lacustris TaxID=2899127 RepID=UPI001EE891AC|nr:PEP-CTERM sorting domain-containing protein [Ectothiorhodospira lacustris]MCG5501829.1 PEP-CTERM sorting domain-containing protein [Ectothiorhodospira lacustris]